jgi:hypothetical protein
MRRALNVIFPGCWTGWDGPTDWPPYSPYIMVLDFFLWGHMKDRIYTTKVRDLWDPRAQIVEAVGTITPDMLQQTWAELNYRLDILCISGSQPLSDCGLVNSFFHKTRAQYWAMARQLRNTAMYHQQCSCRSVLIFYIKLCVLCDWYLSIIRPYLYSSLPENMVKSGHFIAHTLYNITHKNWHLSTVYLVIPKPTKNSWI